MKAVGVSKSMIEYNAKEVELLEKKEFSEYKKYIENNFQDSNQLHYLQVRNIVLIAINTNEYYKCKDNKVRLLTLLSLVSLKSEGNENFTTDEVVKRIKLIAKYFKVSCPEIINNTVYFKPNMNKIRELLQKSMKEVEENRVENIIFKS